MTTPFFQRQCQVRASDAIVSIAAYAIFAGATGLISINSLAQTANTTAAATGSVKRGDPITLNFTNAEIDAVARTMATLTGRNVVVDPVSREPSP
jgi:general secretion pathway protein D